MESKNKNCQNYP